MTFGSRIRDFLKAIEAALGSRPLAVFSIAWIAGTLIYFQRFPNNALHPNFYAEDGTFFFKHLFEDGFLASLVTPFNGYFVWGLFILGEVALLLAKLSSKPELVAFPAAMAWVSYAFLGLCASAPIIFLRRSVSPALALILWLSLSFVPMLGSDFAIIGTLGNLKFAFLYLATLLFLYRATLGPDSRRHWLVDAGVLVCAYTAPTVYFAVALFGLERLWYLGPKTPGPLAEKLKTHGMMSFVVLGLALIPQVVFVLANGIPALPGYLDGPYRWSATVELYLGRTLLHSFLFWRLKNFNDTGVVVLCLALAIFAAWAVRRSKASLEVLFTLALALLGSFLFIMNRPGVSAHFDAYRSSGPDQFFFAQNMIFLLTCAIVLEAFVRRVPRVRAWILLAAFVMVYVDADRAGSFGRKDFMQHSRGSIHHHQKHVCAKTLNADPNQDVTIEVYPTAGWTMSVPRNQLCGGETE